MRFETAQRRRRALGLTSLIDVIFLLLLFFMLASSFSRYQAVPVAAAGSGTGQAERPALLRIHGAGRLDLNGVVVAPGDFEAALRAIAEKGRTTVAVVTGPEATVDDLAQALAALRASGLTSALVTADR